MAAISGAGVLVVEVLDSLTRLPPRFSFCVLVPGNFAHARMRGESLKEVPLKSNGIKFMSKILITGSEGSLAQIVIPHLRKSGHTITGIDNFSRYGVIKRERDYDFVQGDLSDSHQVRDLFASREFDAVFHFAALVYGVIGFHKKPADIICENNLATLNLLKAGHKRIGKFIYLSSSMVYERCQTFPLGETDTDDTPVMSTSYGLSKYIGERAVLSYHEQHGMPYVIWRPFNIITPFEAPEEEGFSHVFTDMVEKILVEKQSPLNVLGDGSQIRCFTNIFDVAEAIERYSLCPEAENEVFNLGQSRFPLTVKELCELIVEKGKSFGLLDSSYELKFRSQPIYSDDVKKRIPDTKKMKATFNWEAKLTPEESITMYIRRKFSLAAETTHPLSTPQTKTVETTRN